MLLTFATIFVPMAGISLILLGITFDSELRIQFPGPEVGTTQLPVNVSLLPLSNSYYSSVGVSTVLSIGAF